MQLLTESFPAKPLTPDQKRFVQVQLGGPPIGDTAVIHETLADARDQVRADALWREFLDDIAWRSTGAVGRGEHSTVVAYKTGMLVYTAVMKMLLRIDHTPYSGAVLGRVGDADALNFAIDSLQAIQEAPEFCELLAEGQAAIGVPGEDRLRFALMGAGALHTIVTRSIEEVTDSGVDSLKQAFPDVDELS